MAQSIFEAERRSISNSEKGREANKNFETYCFSYFFNIFFLTDTFRIL